MKPVCVRSIALYYIVGFENYLAQMIIVTRQCVACKNLDAKSDGNMCKSFLPSWFVSCKNNVVMSQVKATVST